MKKIFISHEKTHKPLAIEIAEALERHSFSAFVDINSIEGGDVWVEKIEQAIEESDFFVLLWSQQAGQSKWVNEEVRLARTSLKACIPFSLDGTPVHKSLKSYQFEPFQNVAHAVELILRKSGITVDAPAQVAPTAKTIEPLPLLQEKAGKPALHKAGELDALFEMIPIEGGSMDMGADDIRHAKPLHKVTLRGFRLGKYPVTQRQWRAVMGSDPVQLNFKGCDDCPVERVSWNDVQEFLQQLNHKTGQRYRLPTEAEWEFAARGGKENSRLKFAGSNVLDEVAWHAGNSGGKTHPVGQKLPNALGFHDLCGNVSEWCSDWYDKAYYQSSPELNPQGPATGGYRVARGGCWNDGASVCLVAHRDHHRPAIRTSHVGFRLAMEV